MTATAVRRLAYAALPVLYLLRNDFWFWDDASRFLGLPVGLSYHVLFCAAVVLTMWWLVRAAWPADELDRLATGGPGGGAARSAETVAGGAGAGPAAMPEDGGRGAGAAAAGPEAGR